MHSTTFFSLAACALVAFAAPQNSFPSPSDAPIQPSVSVIVDPSADPSGSATPSADPSMPEPSAPLPSAPVPTQPGGIEPCIVIQTGIDGNVTIVPSPVVGDGAESAIPSASPGACNPTYVYYSISYPSPTIAWIDGDTPAPSATPADPEASGVVSEVVMPTEAPTPSNPGFVQPSPTTYSCLLSGPLPPSAIVIFPGADTPTPCPTPPTVPVPGNGTEPSMSILASASAF